MSARAFTQDVKDKAYARQNLACAHCGAKLQAHAGHAHFKKPVELGGDTALHNCVILCQKCHLQYGHVSKWARFVITQDYPYFTADGMPH